MILSQVAVLESNFNDLGNRETIAKEIATIIEEKLAKGRGKDGISEGVQRKFFARSTKFILSTKDIGMVFARLDHHEIAPVALGGLYTVAQIIQNDSDEHRAAFSLTLQIVETVALWNSVEQYQILKNRNQNLSALYEELSNTIVMLYQSIIVLLGTMIVYFEKSKWRKLI